MSMSNTRLTVLNDILEERIRQEDKWGEQHWPDGTDREYIQAANCFRDECDSAFKDGSLTWKHILTEEFFEASAEVGWASLRKELIQVAAVCIAWIEDGDQR